MVKRGLSPRYWTKRGLSPWTKGGAKGGLSPLGEMGRCFEICNCGEIVNCAEARLLIKYMSVGALRPCRTS